MYHFLAKYIFLAILGIIFYSLDHGSMPDTKNIANNNNETQENLKKKGGILSYSSKEIVDAFVTYKKSSHSNNYFEWKKNKRSIITDFNDFVKENYPSWVLETLLENKGLDEVFNTYANKWFTLKDFVDNSEKRYTIKKHIWKEQNELKAMNIAVLSCHQQWKKLNLEEQKQFPFWDFLRDCGFKESTDQDGNITNITVSIHSKITTCTDLEEKREQFIHRSTTWTETHDLYLDMMQIDFDPTEKIVCISTVRQLYDRIQELDIKQRTIATSLWEDIFDQSVLWNNPVSSIYSWLSLDGLETSLSDFFTQLSANNIDSKTIDILKNLSINPKTCLLHWTKTGELLKWSYDIPEQNKKFSEMNKKVQSLTSQLTTTHTINNVDKLLSEQETKAEKFATAFSLPGNMQSFFNQFDDSREQLYTTKVPKEKQQEYASLQIEAFTNLIPSCSTIP